MLLSRCIHPEINAVLAAAGHHSTVLIADGNYPALNKRGPNAKLVSLNLMPGLVTVDQVLTALLATVPIESAATMQTEPDGPYALAGDPPVWDEYRRSIAAAGLNVQLEPLEKWSFYDRVITDDHVLTVQTGDQQRYANLLLTIGVRMDAV